MEEFYIDLIKFLREFLRKTNITKLDNQFQNLKLLFLKSIQKITNKIDLIKEVDCLVEILETFEEIFLIDD